MLMDTFEHHFKKKLKKAKNINLMAKHLNEEREGLYRLKVEKPKVEYKRKKLNIRNLDEYTEETE